MFDASYSTADSCFCLLEEFSAVASCDVFWSFWLCLKGGRCADTVNVYGAKEGENCTDEEEEDDDDDDETPFFLFCDVEGREKGAFCVLISSVLRLLLAVDPRTCTESCTGVVCVDAEDTDEPALSGEALKPNCSDGRCRGV